MYGLFILTIHSRHELFPISNTSIRRKVKDRPWNNATQCAEKRTKNSKEADYSWNCHWYKEIFNPFTTASMYNWIFDVHVVLHLGNISSRFSGMSEASALKILDNLEDLRYLCYWVVHGINDFEILLWKSLISKELRLYELIMN